MYTRSTTASLETLLFFLVFFFWLVFCVVILAFAASYGFGRWGSKNIFCDLFALIFLSWFLIPLVGYRTNESYDMARLKQYPLPSWKVYWSNLLGAFLDISVLLPLTAFIAVFLAFRPGPDQLLVGIILILALTFLLIVSGQTLVNTLYILLPRLNLVSAGMVIIIGLFIWALFLYTGLIPHPAQMFNWFIFFVPDGVELFRPYPYGQIAIALDDYLRGEFRAIPGSLIGFGAWTFGVLLFNFILVAYLWETDTLKKSGLKHRHRDGPDPVSKLFGELARKLRPVFGPEAVALYKKDMLEFWARSPYFFIYKVLPGTLAPVIILLAMHWNLENAIQIGEHKELAAIVKIYTVGMVVFIMAAQGMLFTGNQFGFEGGNIRNLLVLPTPRRHLLMGKNIFLGGLFLFDSIVLSIVLRVYFPELYAFFAWFILLLVMFLLILAFGNSVSLIWPYWMPLDKPSVTLRTTVILGLVNVGFTIVLVISMIPPVAMVLLPYIAGIQWLGYLLMPVAIAYGLFMHRIMMKPAVNLFETNEFLVLRRVADQEEL